MARRRCTGPAHRRRRELSRSPLSDVVSRHLPPARRRWSFRGEPRRRSATRRHGQGGRSRGCLPRWSRRRRCKTHLPSECWPVVTEPQERPCLPQPDLHHEGAGHLYHIHAWIVPVTAAWQRHSHPATPVYNFHSGPRASRTGPTATPTSTSAPRCRTTMIPSRANSAATSRAASIKSRHDPPPTIRAASLGQMVASGRRCRNSARTAAASRARWPPGVGSHHGSPRSPSATSASRTRGRARSGSLSTSRRAAFSSPTSCLRSDSGTAGSGACSRR